MAKFDGRNGVDPIVGTEATDSFVLENSLAFTAQGWGAMTDSCSRTPFRSRSISMAVPARTP
jgi:hypothetical protein